ncbi:NAD(P)H-dependent oxidoreductase subunit E [Candidatus Soleaferrea massiliensis]|uniref:NAD(P)H-dependent oxidoreductase subunit E n=1 Tax=Candidatus Soleaferrea massiliensis TaxID=1470354 RepID=UPI00058AFE50|nr:NAD(P)H-dependent oxidoreductase subunit E [Candidatus Soleaferrea massiliensis]
MEQGWSLREAIDYYKGRNAPQDQQALVALLREVQEHSDGTIPAAALDEIADALKLKKTFLSAVVKRFPSLRTEEAPHLLEMCGGERCRKRGCRELHRYVEDAFQVKSGGVSKRGGFQFKVTGCMKNCPNGPSLKWDGTLYSGADQQLIQKLIDDK